MRAFFCINTKYCYRFPMYVSAPSIPIGEMGSHLPSGQFAGLVEAVMGDRRP